MVDSRVLFEKEYCLWRDWKTGGMRACVDADLHMGYPVAVYHLANTTVTAVTEEISDAVPYLETLPADLSYSAIMDDLFEHVTIKPDLAYFTLLRKAAFRPVPVKAGWLVRPLTERDAHALQNLLLTCTKKEQEQGAVSVKDALCLGIFEDDILLSAASFWYWGRTLADVGVVTRADRRGEGTATMAVSALCEKGLANGRLPLYRYENVNAASGRVAEKLGFTQVACLEGGQVFYDEEETQE